MRDFSRLAGKLKSELNISTVLLDEPMSRHTSFRIGGPADIYVEPAKGQLPLLYSVCAEEDVPVTVIGNGSNILVSDSGIRGVCISIGPAMGGIEISDCEVRAGAGELFSNVSKAALSASLTGLEFASGIPGSMGGAVVMNAGAYGGEIKDCIISATSVTADGREVTYEAEKLGLGYRTSIFKGSQEIITDVTLRLTKGVAEEIKAAMDEYTAMRREKQPIEYPSAGSTFKRPEGMFAGKLIMDAGLKGFRVGGAVVSEKHAGFIINDANATAEDVWELMKRVIAIVHDRFGVVLEPEVKFVGKF